MPQDNDIKFMKQALALAESMKGRTSPDPLVGAVIVKDGKAISTGYHAEVTTPHAEAWAISKIQEKDEDRAKVIGSTLYVNLEPCCFFETKNNPPCTQTIIKAGIKRVVVGMQDPNPGVSGKGFKELIDAGIEVTTGVLEKEAKKINEVFIKYITTGIPFVALKSAMSLDGKIATNTYDSKWITNEESRQHVHELRNSYDGVMVGINTVLKDNPQLTARDAEEFIKNPYKIILDPSCKIPLNCNILKNEPQKAIIAVGPRAKKNKIKKLGELGAQVLSIKTKKQRFNIKDLLKKLGALKITSIMIEGGGNTNTLAIESGIVDKFYFFISPKIIGGQSAPTPVEGKGIKKVSKALCLEDVEVKRFGADTLIIGYPLVNPSPNNY